MKALKLPLLNLLLLVCATSTHLSRNRGHNFPAQNLALYEEFEMVQDPKPVRSPYGFHYDSTTEDIENIVAEDMLKQFVIRLRTFVGERSFDIDAFDAASDELSEELAEITKARERLPPSKDIAHLLQFARRLFQLMMDANRLMRAYRDVKVPGYDLVYNVIELGVRAMVLNNEHGVLDVGFEGYMAKLLHLHLNLDFWVSKFKMLSYLPFGTRHLFKVLVTEAERTLHELTGWAQKKHRA